MEVETRVLAAALSVMMLSACATKAAKPASPIPVLGTEVPDGSVNLVQIMFMLNQGLPIDESRIVRYCAYLDQRKDCADFGVCNLLRLLSQFPSTLAPETKDRIKETLLHFKYWMDEPGVDDMCYWSENHQILFASSEYLAGQLYPDEIFTNSGLSGREHMVKSRRRIAEWLGYRWKYGFSEWHSNTYYPFDANALLNLIDFCGDAEISSKSAAILDLLMLDVAMHSYKGVFSPAQGRAYEKEEKSPRADSFRPVEEAVWGANYGGGDSYNRARLILISPKYSLPDVIREIGADRGSVCIKTSQGLDIAELPREGFDLRKPDTGVFLWGMEAFSDHRVIDVTLDLIRKYDLGQNSFFEALNDPYVLFFKAVGLASFVSWVINPITNGVALQRANTYTYKTPYYSLSTTQGYHPGECADQQHIWRAVISPDIAVFTTHPTRPFSESDLLGESPGYWVGSGRLPHSAQMRNVVMTIYRLPAGPALMEKEMKGFTHAFFPRKYFDEAVLEGRCLLGRYGGAFIALIGKSDLRFAEGSDEEVIQDGGETYWICEMGSGEEDGSFEGFRERVKAQTVGYADGALVYETRGGEYRLVYGDGLYVNGERLSTDYARIDAPYCTLNRGQGALDVEFNGERLYLDFEKRVRIIE